MRSDKHLVLIHGAGGRHIDWPKELRHNRLYSVYGLDLPGHFKAADAPPCQSIDEMSDLVSAFIEEKKLTQVVIAGHSMGSLIAQTIGKRQPDWLDGLILLGSTSSMPVTPHILDNIHTNLDAVGDFIAKYAFARGSRGLIKGAVRKIVMENNPDTLFADFSACNAFSITDEELGQIKANTLIIGGKRDKFTPLAQSEHLNAQIPNSTLHVMDAAGHYMFVEQPLQVTRRIHSFMQGRK